MAESFTDRLRRQALRLVFDRKLTPAQAAKKLQCSPRAVRRWVQDHRETEKLTVVEPVFVPVDIIETGDTVQELPSDPIPDKAIALDILTRSGLTLRLQVSSIHDLAELLRTLEADRC